MGLEHLRARLANPTPALHAVGLLLVGRAQRTFAEQRAGGQEWPERGVPNRIGILMDLKAGKNPPERRWDARPAGVDTGRLKGSISYRVEANKVVVGSRVAYASDVQLGGPRTIEVSGELRRALAAWLRKLSNASSRARKANYPAKEARSQAARAAFGPLFHRGVLTVDVPPRPFLEIDDEGRNQIRSVVEAYLAGREV